MEGISAVSGEAEDGATAVAAVGDGRLLANVLEDRAASGRLDPSGMCEFIGQSSLNRITEPDHKTPRD